MAGEEEAGASASAAKLGASAAKLGAAEAVDKSTADQAGGANILDVRLLMDGHFQEDSCACVDMC